MFSVTHDKINININVTKEVICIPLQNLLSLIVSKAFETIETDFKLVDDRYKCCGSFCLSPSQGYDSFDK